METPRRPIPPILLDVPSAYLVSDLHLEDGAPALIEVFMAFLEDTAPSAAALFLLGDIFDAWVGDDDDRPFLDGVANALGKVRASGTATYFMHGNRDFLVGTAFAERAGMEILPDPSVVRLGGIPTLLAHGDALCTDETRYQAFRAMSRTPEWQAALLATPLEHRRALARTMRAESMGEHRRRIETGEPLGDVSEDAVVDAMAAAGVERLIHGHTHRPARHAVPRVAAHAERIVIADWREDAGEALHVDGAGTVTRLPLALPAGVAGR